MIGQMILALSSGAESDIGRKVSDSRQTNNVTDLSEGHKTYPNLCRQLIEPVTHSQSPSMMLC